MGLLSFKPFRKIPTTDRDLNLIQSHIADSFSSLNTTPRVLLAVALVAGVNLVSHGLGRNYVTWWPANYDTSVTLKPVATFNGNPVDRSKYFAIQASGNVTADFLVF